MKTKKTDELIRHMFSELEAPSRELTKWEENFIESVSDYYHRRGTLSDAQFEVLERIYAEKTS